jgi:hypothetical protein
MFEDCFQTEEEQKRAVFDYADVAPIVTAEEDEDDDGFMEFSDRKSHF